MYVPPPFVGSRSLTAYRLGVFFLFEAIVSREDGIMYYSSLIVYELMAVENG